jgi:hypothetical protein
MNPDPRYQEVGRLNRVESDTLVVSYAFDLRTNELKADRIPNPNAGKEHKFIAYRLIGQASKPVSMINSVPVIDENAGADEE